MTALRAPFTTLALRRAVFCVVGVVSAATILTLPAIVPGLGVLILWATGALSDQPAPVVAPGGPPYSEFAHGISFEVDPLDPDSIAQGLQRAVAAGKQSVGARRAADFSWERAVEAHADLYRERAA